MNKYILLLLCLLLGACKSRPMAVHVVTRLTPVPESGPYIEARYIDRIRMVSYLSPLQKELPMERLKRTPYITVFETTISNRGEYEAYSVDLSNISLYNGMAVYNPYDYESFYAAYSVADYNSTRFSSFLYYSSNGSRTKLGNHLYFTDQVKFFLIFPRIPENTPTVRISYSNIMPEKPEKGPAYGISFSYSNVMQRSKVKK